MDQQASAQALQAIQSATHILVIQAENPDGDSLGSSVALEAFLMELGKKVTMFCAVNIPGYLHYIEGWSRVTNEFPRGFDLAIIVDTSSKTLLEKTFTSSVLANLSSVPVIIFDHHTSAKDLPFETIDVISNEYVATGQLLVDFAIQANWQIPKDAADAMLASILSDSLGLSSEAVSVKTMQAVTTLMQAGATINSIEERRRDYMRKSQDILAYKGRLIERIEYFLDGALAVIHIPWEEIEQYSDKYNPSVLVIDEMRMVENVRIAVAFKTYPDGKITAKLRANSDSKVCVEVAGFFGGGGHPSAAGFKVYGETYETIKREAVEAVHDALTAYDKNKE